MGLNIQLMRLLAISNCLFGELVSSGWSVSSQNTWSTGVPTVSCCEGGSTGVPTVSCCEGGSARQTELFTDRSDGDSEERSQVAPRQLRQL